MSKILSVYNNWAFCDTVLPAGENVEYTFLVDSQLFHLERNISIHFECVNGVWKILRTGDVSDVFEQNAKSGTVGNSEIVFSTVKADTEEAIGSIDYQNGVPVLNKARYTVRTNNGETFAILSENRETPLVVYSKFELVSGQPVSIGTEQDCSICYRFPADPKEKSLVSHHHCTIRYDGEHAALSDTSTNGTFVNNHIAKGETQLHFGDSIHIFHLNIIYLGNILAIDISDAPVVQLHQIAAEDLSKYEKAGSIYGSSKKVPLHRSPRIVPRVENEEVVIEPPPAPKDEPNRPLIMQIGPSLTMAIPMIMGALVTVVSSGSNPGMMMMGLVTSVSSAALGSIWAVANVRNNKKTRQEEERRRFAKYGQYVADREEYIADLYQKDTQAFLEKYESPEAVSSYRAEGGQLWNRNFNHTDVLNYRIGLGDIPFPVHIKVQAKHFTMIDDAIAKRPQEICDQYSIMHDVPVCLDLRENSLVGIIGESESWVQIVQDLLVQIAGNNSYSDVRIAFAFDEKKQSDTNRWDYVKWFPHIWSEDHKIRYFATNPEECSEVFYSLNKVFRKRIEEGEDATILPYIILFVLDKDLLEGELISKYIGQNSDKIGLSTIVTANRYEDLPNNCEYIIENNEGFHGTFSTLDEFTEKKPVLFDQISRERSTFFAKSIANVETKEGSAGAGEIPNAVTFFEMYGISRPEQLGAADRWRKAKTYETMKALIGQMAGGVPCYLDLHERYHGPHGLVAGTTGSGKSETLQTYILSLAINYSPYDVGFFIIDYKGGGMSNLFERLPHMIGAISNLSGNQVRRAMVSIKSENKRRQRIFSEYGVNNINAYTRLYKNGDVKDPIPHLMIIIDEFAELKREEPEFMRELVSVAQVGRSLGVHLILSTQKPAGTVDENIWSNSKFKICLRVQDRQDSMDMLHRPDAAYLTQTGRGFLQVGNNELFEEFQSGYSGATYDETLGDQKLVVAQMLDSVGKVDIAGNHLKIQHQKEVQKRWVQTLINACGLTANLDSSQMERLSTNREILDKIYEDVASQGYEGFEKTGNNDKRLAEFANLLRTVPSSPEEDYAERVMAALEERGSRLPERKTFSQLDAVTRYLGKVAIREKYDHKFMLWMPPLPIFLPLGKIEGFRPAELQSHEKKWTLSAVIGLGDDPENQTQMPIVVDFGRNGHHALCGTVATGKSTFLQTTIYSLINRYSSSHLNIYILDFSSKLLTVFEDAKQVGGIMTDAEEDLEKISKFFTMIKAIIQDRKKKLASTNYHDYKEHGGTDLPAILIVIDNYAGFKDKTSEQYDALIMQISKEGLGYGIYLLMSAGGFSTSEIPNRLAENFRTTIALEMPDQYAYSDIMRVVKPPILPETNVKGRGLVWYGDKIIEFQTAVAVEGESILKRNDRIRNDVKAINDRITDKPAKKIPVIPDNPTWEEYAASDEYQEILSKPNLLPNGYDATTAAYSAIDLTSLLTYVVSGTKKSGKSTYLKTIIRAASDKKAKIAVMEIGSTEFQQVAEYVGADYLNTPEAIFTFAEQTLLPEVKKRVGKKKECVAKHLEDPEFFDAMMAYQPVFVFIPHLSAFIKTLYDKESKANKAVSVYETLVGEKGWHYNFYFFLELEDSETSDVLGYLFMRNIRDNKAGIRFGGRYLSQKLFTFENISLRDQSKPLKTGIGVIPSEDDMAPLQKVVVPNYKG